MHILIYMVRISIAIKWRKWECSRMIIFEHLISICGVFLLSFSFRKKCNNFICCVVIKNHYWDFDLINTSFLYTTTRQFSLIAIRLVKCHRIWGLFVFFWYEINNFTHTHVLIYEFKEKLTFECLAWRRECA